MEEHSGSSTGQSHVGFYVVIIISAYSLKVVFLTFWEILTRNVFYKTFNSCSGWISLKVFWMVQYFYSVWTHILLLLLKLLSVSGPVLLLIMVGRFS